MKKGNRKVKNLMASGEGRPYFDNSLNTKKGGISSLVPFGAQDNAHLLHAIALHEDLASAR